MTAGAILLLGGLIGMGTSLFRIVAVFRVNPFAPALYVMPLVVSGVAVAGAIKMMLG